MGCLLWSSSPQAHISASNSTRESCGSERLSPQDSMRVPLSAADWIPTRFKWSWRYGMSNTHGWQPLEKPNQHSLCLLLNQLLSYSFRNTKSRCLPAMRKSECGSETSAWERMRELKLCGLPCVSWEEEEGYKGWWEQSLFVDGQVLTRLVHLSQWHDLWIHSTAQLRATLNPCFLSGWHFLMAHTNLGNGLTWAIWKPAAYFTAVNWGFPTKAGFLESACSYQLRSLWPDKGNDEASRKNPVSWECSSHQFQ